MKIKIISFLFIILIAVISVMYDSIIQPENISQDTQNNISTIDAMLVPEIKAVTLGGKELALHDLKEEVVLLHFWAAWCSVCMEEFPAILELAKRYDGKVAIYAISIDDKQKDALKFRNRLKKIAKIEVEVPHVYWLWDKDKQVSLKLFNTVKVPETIVLNKDRLMVKKIVGATDWLGKDIKNTLDTL